MSLRSRTVLSLVAVLVTVPAFSAAPPPLVVTYNVKLECGVRVPMRDGVRLATDVYRPDAPGRFPVVLQRTPYDKGTVSYVKRGRFYASHGFVCVMQDVRGRGESDGEFYPLRHEAEDGYDTQTWCGTQEWSTGKVGIRGASYDAWTQLYAAVLNNPHLAAMMPVVAPPDPLKNIPIQYGAYSLPTAVWLAETSGRTLQDISQYDLMQTYRSLPLEDIGTHFGRKLQVWRDWLAHPALDEYWQPMCYQGKLLDVRVPALHLSGWYDDDLVGTTENFIALSQHARDVDTRRRQKLIIGPWGHAVNAGTKLGDIDFGPTALIDLDELPLRWFRRWLLGADNGIDRELPVRIFVMGANQWRDEQEWPLERTRYTKYYLHSGGRANSRFGDGVLSPEPPREEKPDGFTYDPGNPVPFITELSFLQIGGPDDYRPVERRDDVLVYSTPPLTEPMEICGPLKVELFAASSAKDTDWTAKVLDVHPDGYAQRLNDGIIRARFRKGLDRQVPLEPGKAEEYEIDCWSTCILLSKGHRLRVEISSSAFPKFDRNLNTGGPIGTEKAGVPAEQTVFHDRGRASYVLLPIVPAFEEAPVNPSGGGQKASAKNISGS
jgi:putative CocE/NonD family hydrolase